MPWRHLLRPGDYVVILCASLLCVFAFAASAERWQQGSPAFASVRYQGRLFAKLSLDDAKAHEVTIETPLGRTVIRAEAGRARVVSDPGYQQYCVRQGWLTRVGDIAICAPTAISLSIEGHDKQYDSLTY